MMRTNNLIILQLCEYTNFHELRRMSSHLRRREGKYARYGVLSAFESILGTPRCTKLDLLRTSISLASEIIGL